MDDPISHMSDAQVERAFEKMLDDMNLTEDKKVPLRRKKVKQKREMLKLHYKGSVQQTRLKFTTASDYVTYLRSHRHVGRDGLAKCLEGLKISLSNNPIPWVLEFGEHGGLDIILEFLDQNLKEPIATVEVPPQSTGVSRHLFHIRKPHVHGHNSSPGFGQGASTLKKGSREREKDVVIRREILLCISKIMKYAVSIVIYL